MRYTERPIVSADRLRELLDYSPETGVFTWRTRVGKIAAGSIAGSKDVYGYWNIQVDGRMYKAHRLAWLHVHGEWPGGPVDHKFGVVSDNRIALIRVVTKRLNCENQRKAQARNKAGILGVTLLNRGRRRFMAQIGVDGKNVYLGKFMTSEEASQAYLTAKRQLHAGCTI